MSDNCMTFILDKDKTLVENIDCSLNKWSFQFYSSVRTIYMNSYLYDVLCFNGKGHGFSEDTRTFRGLDVVINENLGDDRIQLSDSTDAMRYVVNDVELTRKAWYKVSANNDLPVRYIINKGATILFWSDGTKTIVKRDKDDEYDKVKGFLWAYFQKHSGLSKTKANKYLAGLQDVEDIEFNKALEKGTFYGAVSNAFKELFK